MEYLALGEELIPPWEYREKSAILLKDVYFETFVLTSGLYLSSGGLDLNRPHLMCLQGPLSSLNRGLTIQLDFGHQYTN